MPDPILIDTDGLDYLIGLARSACGDMALIEEQAGILAQDSRVGDLAGLADAAYTAARIVRDALLRIHQEVTHA